jgi:hypothetical protein
MAMKKTLLFSVIIMSASLLVPAGIFAQAQLENASFEKWDTLAYDPDNNILIVEPVKWSSLKTADNLSDVAPDVCRLSGDAHSGNYSVHLINMSSFGTVANGLITSGRVHAEIDKEKAYTFTDPDNWEWHMRLSGRPDSIAGWYKYSSADGDIGTFDFSLHTGYFRKPARAEDSLNLVGSAYFETPSTSVNEWTRFCVPVQYFKADTAPEFILITISSGNSYNAKDGSEMWVDDLEMIYNEGNTTAVVAHPVSSGDLKSWYTGGVLNILLKKPGNQTYRFSVSDMTGRTVYTGVLEANNPKQIPMKTTEGIYIIRINDHSEVFTKKIFIK